MPLKRLTVEDLQTPEGVRVLNEFLQTCVTYIPEELKTGTTQTTAGAGAGELYVDTDTNAVMLGT